MLLRRRKCKHQNVCVMLKLSGQRKLNVASDEFYLFFVGKINPIDHPIKIGRRAGEALLVVTYEGSLVAIAMMIYGGLPD